MSGFFIGNPYFIIVVCLVVAGAPMAKATIGGPSPSVLLTILIEPAACIVIYQRKENSLSHA